MAEGSGRKFGGRGGGGALSTKSLNSNSLSVYKSMMEKERKQWQEERSRKDAFISEMQTTVLKQGNELSAMEKQVEDMEADITMRDQCEAKVNQYVQELIDKNTMLTN